MSDGPTLIVPAPKCPAKRDRKAYSKWYYETHKKQCQAASDRWWKNHKDKLRAKLLRRKKNHPERVRRLARECRLRNLESRRSKNLKWQSDNWEYRQQYMREYYARNADKIRARSRKHYRDNPASTWLAAQKRRALIDQASANLELLQNFVSRIKKKKWCYCYYCERKVSSSNIHFDHIIPLSKGGQHSVDNLCISCAPCNLSKHTSTPGKWKKHPQLFLDL